MLVFVVLGGIGNMPQGSVIAAALLTILPELLRAFSRDYRMLVYAGDPDSWSCSPRTARPLAQILDMVNPVRNIPHMQKDEESARRLIEA